MSWATDWEDTRSPADREREQLEAIARDDARRAAADHWRRCQAARWRRLRRRELAIKITDHIMRLRAQERGVGRWLGRLARLTAG